MKFGEQLSTHLTPEWRKQYIHYEELKQLLYDTINEMPEGSEDDEARERLIAQADEKFFELCDQQLHKVDLFFKMKLADAERKHNELNRELSAFKRLSETDAALSPKGNARDDRRPLIKAALTRSEQRRARETHTKTMSQLKFAFSEFYLSLVLLQNYQSLNAMGFRKILKKHDKVFQNGKGLEYRQTKVEKAPIFTNNNLEQMINAVENTYTHELERGNRQVAMKRLRVPPLYEQQSAWTTFRLGFFFGCFAILLMLIISFTNPQYDPSRRVEPKWVGVRLFRGFLVLFINIWLMGFNVYGWQRSGVNHVLIFEIDPRNHLTYQSLMEVASFFIFLWALCVLGYVYMPIAAPQVPPLIFPLILMGICLLWTINPLDKPVSFFHRSSRFWLIKHVFFCFTAPFHQVTFPDFWLADQMNSLVTFFLDMQYFVCFYSLETEYGGEGGIVARRAFNETTTEKFAVNYVTGDDYCFTNHYGIRPLIAVLPATIRFLQCLRRFRDTGMWHPHLVNAGKYCTSYFVVGFGLANSYYKAANDLSDDSKSPFFYIWICAYVFSFVYTFLWDILMDWSLFDAKAPPTQRFLREELIYDWKWFYYFAILEDAVLRLSWVVNVSLGDTWSSHADILMCITAILECFRRFIWNFLRLENEHVNNCGQFRAVRDISLKPIKRGELEKLFQRIDLADGITHRGRDFIEDDRKRRKDRKPKKRVFAGFARKISSAAIGRSVAPKTRSSPRAPVKEHREGTHLQVPPSIAEMPATSMTQPESQDDKTTTTRLARKVNFQDAIKSCKRRRHVDERESVSVSVSAHSKHSPTEESSEDKRL